MQTQDSSISTPENPQIELAFQFLSLTNKHIFLTGKAGTGKTTFLKRVRKEVKKRIAVVAPTGVAAINAEGVTIHSLFQLPFGTLTPETLKKELRKKRFSSQKIKLIKSLDLLIIDEISMVRADTLDAIDAVLRRYRDFSRPFGGVQLLMIGDLHQLPPIVKPQDWELMRPYYSTAYFFGSIALQKAAAIPIELLHIYRQSDQYFIDLLNKVRNNQMGPEVIEALHSRHRPNFQPSEEEEYITLTSHNKTSMNINSERLQKLAGESYIFRADVDGDFPEQVYPTAANLQLKIGAQVMFVKNDLSGMQLYYNGKIGKVTAIEGDRISVQCPGDPQPIEVTPVDWHNRKFILEEKSKEVKEEIVGRFTQHPLQLAWAITIHKSQGLTFDKVIIDAKDAFAHGQVYVALSRCKTFEGIVLKTPIVSTSVKTDQVVKKYTEDARAMNVGSKELKEAQRQYQIELLKDLFSFKHLHLSYERFLKIITENESALQGQIYLEAVAVLEKIKSQLIQVAKKFQPQLEIYFQTPGLPEDNQELQNRLKKASAYFAKQLKEQIIPTFKELNILSDNKAVKKKVREQIVAIHTILSIKKASFEYCTKSFSTLEYEQVKINTELDSIKTKKISKAPQRSPKEASHPKLFEILNQWRAETATEKEVARFQVLSTKSLLEIVEVLPTTLSALHRVHGIGKVRAEKYGQGILELVKLYVEVNQLESNLLQHATGKAPKAKKAPRPDTKLVSYEHYKDGKSIAEIAAHRGLASSTVESHLAHFVGTGALPVHDFVAKEKVDIIAKHFAESEDTSFTNAKQKLGDEVSYSELRMVLSHLKSQEEEEEEKQ